MLCSAAVMAALSYAMLQRYLDQPLSAALENGQPDSEGIVVTIPEGSGMNRIANLLAAEAGLRWPRVFSWWVRSQGLDRNIGNGEYAVTSGMTPRSLLSLLMSGRNVQYPATLIEGWTFQQALEFLWQLDTVDNTLQGLAPPELSAALQTPFPALEGSLFPDTYFHTRGTTDLQILRRATQRLQQILAEEWQARDIGLPYENQWQALIMASIIERESGYQAEKPEIAGVFVRRLQQGMRLQSDPTVIYGAGENYTGVIRRSDLDTTTPWNTYRISGLPPTPIALSGRDSINASLHPAAGTALYFVSRGDGSHQFSDTLEQHNAAVRQYLRPANE